MLAMGSRAFHALGTPSSSALLTMGSRRAFGILPSSMSASHLAQSFPPRFSASLRAKPIPRSIAAPTLFPKRQLHASRASSSPTPSPLKDPLPTSEAADFVMNPGGGDEKTEEWADLHHAAGRGNLEEVKRLLELPTPKVRQLLMARNVPKSKSAWSSFMGIGKTALHVAAAAGHLDVVKYRIERGGEELLMEKMWASGDTALHTAIQDGQDARESGGERHLGVVQHLVEAGGWKLLQSSNMFGWNALHCAAQFQNLEALKLLLVLAGTKKEVLLLSRDEKGNTALHLAARDVHPEELKHLLQAGCSKLLWARNKYGNTVLHSAVCQHISWRFSLLGLERLEVVKHLSEAGGTKLLNAPNDDGLTAAEVARETLDYYVDSNTKEPPLDGEEEMQRQRDFREVIEYLSERQVLV